MLIMFLLFPRVLHTMEPASINLPERARDKGLQMVHHRSRACMQSTASCLLNWTFYWLMLRHVESSSEAIHDRSCPPVICQVMSTSNLQQRNFECQVSLGILNYILYYLLNRIGAKFDSVCLLNHSESSSAIKHFSVECYCYCILSCLVLFGNHSSLRCLYG